MGTIPFVDPTSSREVVLTDAFAYNGQYEAKAKGYRDIATAGQTTDLNFAVGAEDRYMNGVALILVGHAEADTIDLKVVDVDSIIPEPARVAFPDYPVLKKFGESWNVDHERCRQDSVVFSYVARLAAGLYLQLTYTSTGLLGVKVKLNALMHKKIA
jgi:hypothetical protein